MFSSYSRPGFLVCYFDKRFSSIWREQLGHGESTECPSKAFYPLCRSKAAADVGWIEGCFDKGVSSFVCRRRTWLSKVTFLKVGWVKISQFLPRGLTQGELGKIEPTGVPLEVWAGFGIGILVLAPKFPYVVSIPATHTRNSSHSTNSSHSSEGIALHSWGGTHTVKSSRSARSAHSIKSSYSVNETFFFVFFLLKWPGITYSGIWGRWNSHLRRRKFHILSHSKPFLAKKNNKIKESSSSAGWMW